MSKIFTFLLSLLSFYISFIYKIALLVMYIRVVYQFENSMSKVSCSCPPCTARQADCGSSEGIPPVGWEESHRQEARPGGGSGGLLCNRSTVTRDRSSIVFVLGDVF